MFVGTEEGRDGGREGWRKGGREGGREGKGRERGREEGREGEIETDSVSLLMCNSLQLVSWSWFLDLHFRVSLMESMLPDGV